MTLKKKEFHITAEFSPLVKSLWKPGVDYTVCPDWLAQKARDAGYPVTPEKVLAEGYYDSFDPHEEPIALGNQGLYNITVFIFRKYKMKDVK